MVRGHCPKVTQRSRAGPTAKKGADEFLVTQDARIGNGPGVCRSAPICLAYQLLANAALRQPDRQRELPVSRSLPGSPLIEMRPERGQNVRDCSNRSVTDGSTRRSCRQHHPSRVAAFVLRRPITAVDVGDPATMSACVLWVTSYKEDRRAENQPSGRTSRRAGHTSRLCFTAASMKLANSGCGSNGLLLSSGWNCTPTNQG